MPIPSFESTPQKAKQALRSAGPSPSPRRAELKFIHHHRASSFSPDEPDLPVYALGDGYFPQSQEIGIAKDADSDWDDMISDDGGKLRPQSRLFFDTHVEELVGGLFERKLDPVLVILSAINDTLGVGVLPPKFTSRCHANMAQSDADDEDDITPSSPKSPKDRKLEKIKAALSEVLLAQQHDTANLEQSLREIKDAVVTQNYLHEIVEVKSALLDVFSNIARSEDIAVVKTLLNDVFLKAEQNTELVKFVRSLVPAIEGTAKAEDVNAIRQAVANAMAAVAQGADLIDLKLSVQEMSTKIAQQSDVADIKAAVTDTLLRAASKEDLVPLHNVLAEAFAKTAKTDELAELNRIMVEIMNGVLGIDVKATHLEVLKLRQENENVRNTLSEMLRLTQDNAENMDFQQDVNAEVMKEGQATLSSRVGEVYGAVREMTQFMQSRATKSDMRKNLSEKGQKENVVEIKKAIVDSTQQIQDGLCELGRSHPSLEEIQAIVDKAITGQVSPEELRQIVDEATGILPGAEDIKKSAQEAIRAEVNVAEFRKVIEEAGEHNLEEFKSAVDQISQSQPTLQDFRSLMEDVISKQQLFVPLNFEDDKETKDKLRRKIESLEMTVTQIEKRGDDEAQSKRAWEERAIRAETELTLSREEVVKQREEAEDKEQRLKALDEKRHQTLSSAQIRSALLEGAHSSLQKLNGDLSAKNAELEGCLRQAQESEAKHQAWSKQMEEENRELRRAIETLRSETEESIKVRESFRTKFDRVQEDMRRVSLEIGQEQGNWRRIQEEQKARIDVLEARISAEVTKSEGLEGEVRRLEVEEKEAIRLRVELEQLRKSNGKTEDRVAQLIRESTENQNLAAQRAHDVDQTRQAAREEVTKVRLSLQRDIDAANTEVNSVRNSLEKEIDCITQDAAVEKEKMGLILKEAQDSKEAALQEAEKQKENALKEAAESKTAALQDQLHKYERQLEEIRAQHERSYQVATEDAEREQYFLQQRLDIAQTESKHLREHIGSLQAQVRTLNENFKIANVAAQAAAQAATTVREMTAPHVSDEYALRESVDVLQSQLQEREARIEQLEIELAGINKDKIRETEGQLNMYRELLDLRIDDLEEIIHSCSLPHLDRGSLRDAATRLKASLEMQLHEKEREMGITKPDSSTVNLASKIPNAASAVWRAWGNRGKTSTEMSKATPPSSTPSRPSSVASGFFNGILTPPSTLANAQQLGARLVRTGGGSIQGAPSHRRMSARQMDKRPASATARRPAAGPHLFRKDHYDADADSSVLSGEFYDEDDDDATETGGDHGNVESFGASPYRSLR
jgi:2C-methyl-D-erythritol 2,4-cyclodiphosphate synthase